MSRFDILLASLLQLYQYELVSSVDASDCSPLEFKKKELESSPFTPPPKKLPSGIINKWSSS
jgi:hypothetical protein